MQKLIAICALLFISTTTFAAENLFYILHNSDKPAGKKALQDTISQIQNNHNAINIIVSQAYNINEKGDVTGFVNKEIIDLAKTHSIKVMAMVTNLNFEQAKAHQFLSSEAAQDKALNFILDACKTQKLYGVQFDFEMISIKDKAALTKFFKKAAELLHKNGFAVSFAIVPALSDTPGPSAFLQKTHENWSGAYDLKALGEYGDIITLMTYNQHPDGTTPGPSASPKWVEASLKHTLKYVPASKLSLGIPTYSLYWYTGGSKHVATHRYEISYADAKHLIKKHNAHVTWNEKDKVNFAVYNHNWLNEYIYLEDAQSFKPRLAIVKKYHLRGISVFRIGTEDEKIWALLKTPGKDKTAKKPVSTKA